MCKKCWVILLIIVFIGFSVWITNYFGLSEKGIKNGKKIILQQQLSTTIIQQSNRVPFRLEEYARRLYVPWSIVFTGQNRVLVTERNGNIRVIENGVLQEKPLIIFPEVSSQSEEGLMGMVLHPLYNKNKRLYVCLAYQKSGTLAGKVVELKDEGGQMEVIKTIFDNIPAAQNHAGCRLKFGPDGKLYITTGDATDKQIAQDLTSLGGKILRINDDGSIPSDNPFSNSPVWSLGHRNPQGIAWHPATGELFSSEHGPSGFDGPGGGDEINKIVKGGNYGWPIVSHEKIDPRFTSPLLVFTPAEAPASAMFYSGNLFPQFNNNFFFGALKGEGIIRIFFDEKDISKVISYEKLSDINVGRIRDIVEGSDGYIYFSTSNRDGRGTLREGDDKIYRLIPENNNVSFD